jgi:hypothetical protein
MCYVKNNSKTVYRNNSDTVYRNSDTIYRNSDTVYRTVVQFTLKCKKLYLIMYNIFSVSNILHKYRIPTYRKNILADKYFEHGTVYLFFEFPDESNFRFLDHLTNNEIL